MNGTGKLTVFTGPMYAGKTTAILIELKALFHQGVPKGDIRVYRPAADTRTEEGCIISHDSIVYPATTVRDAEELGILLELEKPKIVFLDEVNMFIDRPEVDYAIVDICLRARRAGIRVFVAGLSTDFRQRPFRPIPELCAHADRVEVLSAVCRKCGKEARYSRRIVDSDKLILPGDGDKYEPRCPKCFDL